MKKRYNDFNTYLRDIYGCRVQKITVDAGLNCPNRDDSLSSGGCIYCNPRGSGTGAHARGISIYDQIMGGKAALAKRYKAKKFIAYFQSFSNTYAPVETLKALYDEALSVTDVVALSIGTRPDCVDDEILDMLQAFTKTHLVWIEYGLQSIHDDTLMRINRGHDFSCFQKAVTATRQRDLKICAHIILGLPGENRQKMLATARRVAQMGIDGIKIHLLYIIKNTPLENLYRQGGYTCLTQEAYTGIVCDVLECLPPQMTIQRLTGDPHPAELVAPAWSMQKAQTLALINTTMEKRNSFQGLLYPA